MNGASKPAYFPVGTLTLSLAVVDQKGTHHTKEYPIKPENREVEARDHFIVNFNTPDQGTMGNITITADDKTREYTFDFPVPSHLLAGGGRKRMEQLCLREGKSSLCQRLIV